MIRHINKTAIKLLVTDHSNKSTI